MVQLSKGVIRDWLTVAFHPLVDESIEEGATVVAERGTAVRVDLKLVLASGVLETHTQRQRLFHCFVNWSFRDQQQRMKYKKTPESITVINQDRTLLLLLLAKNISTPQSHFRRGSYDPFYSFTPSLFHQMSVHFRTSSLGHTVAKHFATEKENKCFLLNKSGSTFPFHKCFPILCLMNSTQLYQYIRFVYRLN